MLAAGRAAAHRGVANEPPEQERATHRGTSGGSPEDRARDVSDAVLGCGPEPDLSRTVRFSGGDVFARIEGREARGVRVFAQFAAGAKRGVAWRGGNAGLPSENDDALRLYGGRVPAGGRDRRAGAGFGGHRALARPAGGF